VITVNETLPLLAEADALSEAMNTNIRRVPNSAERITATRNRTRGAKGGFMLPPKMC
jgi:hypothetical protein